MPKYFRWYRSGEDLKKAKNKVLQYTDGGQPSNKAFWVFDMEQTYRPSSRLYSGRVLVYLEFQDDSRIRDRQNHINFSDPEESAGESGYPNKVLVKENESGAYGIGKDVLSGLKLKSVRLAEAHEVAKALGHKGKKGQASNKGVDVQNVMDRQKWPK